MRKLDYNQENCLYLFQDFEVGIDINKTEKEFLTFLNEQSKEHKSFNNSKIELLEQLIEKHYNMLLWFSKPSFSKYEKPVTKL